MLFGQRLSTPIAGILFCLSAIPGHALPAFPGAEGFGANALGGRGGDVYLVTNLNDSGPGSLRSGISSASGPRTIVFKVSGNIRLASNLNINRPRLTIAGQTAPGGGICVQNYSLVINASDIVLRHLRTRLGTNALQESDSLWISGGTNIIVDHCSASWSVDETLSATDAAQNVTVQWCYISESLNNSIHSKGRHGYGSLVTPGVTTGYTWHHNLYAHHYSRNPRPGSGNGAVLRFDFRNNVIYNWRDRAGYSGGLAEFVEMNYDANYLLDGPSGDYDYAFQGGSASTVIHQAGNRIDLNRNERVDGTDIGWSMFSGSYTPTNLAFATPAVMTDTAPTAFERVLAQAGAMPWRRDVVDARITESVRRQTGQIVDFVSTTDPVTDYITNSVGGTNYIGVGPWPALGSEAPPPDADADGMPDYWETALGLNPNNPADRNDLAASGYTELEEYLNWLAEPHAAGGRNGPLEVDLSVLNGGSGGHLTFTAFGATNGTVSLLGDGHTARFVPPANFSGRASFAFSANDPVNNLRFGPVPVGVLIAATNAPNANAAPTLEPIVDQTINAGATLTFTNVATDPDVPSQALTFSLLTAPTNAVLDPPSGLFTWRPWVDQADTTNLVSVRVSDDGLPSLSATRSFRVTVNPLAQPGISGASWTNGRLVLLVNGAVGPDYAVQVSSNLIDWETQFTTNSPLTPFSWLDTNASGPMRFYRAVLGPPWP
jgi:pectate lyase